MINVLVAEDSPVSRELIAGILGSEPGIRVVAATDNGRDAVELTRRLRPDVVAMDVVMPGLDGFGATSAIMRLAPTPTLLMSNYFDCEQPIFLRNAARAHAWAVAPKPPAPDAREFDAAVDTLVTLVKEAAQDGTPASVDEWSAEAVGAAGKRTVVVVGAGHCADSIRQTMAGIGAEIPAAIVLVVDDPNLMRTWLHDSSQMPIVLPHAPTPLYPGITYLLPSDRVASFARGSELNLLASLHGGPACSVARVLEGVADGLGSEAIVVFRDDTSAELGLGLVALRLSGAAILAETNESLCGPTTETGRVACAWADEMIHADLLGPTIGRLIGRGPLPHNDAARRS